MERRGGRPLWCFPAYLRASTPSMSASLRRVQRCGLSRRLDVGYLVFPARVCVIYALFFARSVPGLLSSLLSLPWCCCVAIVVCLAVCVYCLPVTACGERFWFCGRQGVLSGDVCWVWTRRWLSFRVVGVFAVGSAAAPAATMPICGCLAWWLWARPVSFFPVDVPILLSSFQCSSSEGCVRR